jgi:hypothetical protein
MDTEMMNTLRSKYFLYINLGTHYCDEPINLLYLYSVTY